MASLGMVLVVIAPSTGQGGLAVDATGLALGLVGAASNTVYALLAARGYASLPAMQASAAIGVLAAAGFLATAALGGSLAAVAQPLQTGGWEWLVLAAVIGQAIPAVAYIAGFRRIGPTGASILMLLEPVVAVMLAVLLVSERPSPLQLVGGLMVLAGGVLVHVGEATPRTVRGAAPGA
jgi:drug/metabolite transporter (DMT)-like permease